MSKQKQYWAFVSYSSKDKRWGQWLHRRLENYPIPKEFQGSELFDGAVLGKNLRPVFRDRDELSGSADLGSAIREALEASRFLVVLCSKNSAKSEWANKEIEDFQAMGNGNRILALILDGEPNAENPEEECFPPALRYPAEPIAGDLRKEGDGKERGFLKILAGISQVGFDDLYRRHEHAQARKRLIAVALAVSLIAIFAGLAGYAWKQRNEATAAKSQAQDQIVEAARKAYGTARDVFATGQDPRTGFAHLAEALRYNTHVPPEMKLAVVSDDAIQRVLNMPNADPAALCEPMQHEDNVVDARFSPDGRRVVTVSMCKEVQLWDTASGKPIGEWMRNEKMLGDASFSPDGRYLTTSWESVARVWETATGKLVGVPMRHEADVNSASFSPDGRLVATASNDNTARLWDAATGKPVGEPMLHEGPVRIASFSLDGTRVVTASDDGTARLWDTATGNPIVEPMRHEHKVNGASFSPDGRHVVTASNDNTVRLWDAATGNPIVEPMRHEHKVNSASFSPDGRHVVTASNNNTARLWDAATGKSIGEPMQHDQAVISASLSERERRVLSMIEWQDQEVVLSASFSPDGRRVVTASNDKTARLWDAATGEPVGVPIRHEEWVRSAGFSPNGRLVVTASDDNSARFWNAATGKLVGQSMRHEEMVGSVSFSPDGRRVVTASKDNSARLWDVATGKPVGEPMRHEDTPWFARFSPDGRVVLTGGADGAARLWDAATGKPIGKPMPHDSMVVSASFSPDGTLVFTASEDKTARLWDATTSKPVGEPMRHDREVDGAICSPDGRLVVTAIDDTTARLWDVVTGKFVGEPMRHDGEVWSAICSPDGRLLVMASRDKTARVWDATTGKAIGEPLRYVDKVFSASFSPDGRVFVIAIASDDKTVQLWDAATGNPVGEPMRHEGKVISAAFSPDCSRVVTTGDAGSVQLWDAANGKFVTGGADPLAAETGLTNESLQNEILVVQPLASTIVNPNDIEFLAGKKINQDGEAVDIPQSEITAWRLKLLAQPADQDDAWRSLLRWKLSDPTTRTISFHSRTTAPEHIEREVTWAMSHLDDTKKDSSILTEAYDLDPASPLIHLALAAIEENEVSRDFLKDYGLKRLAAAEAISDKAAHQAFAGTYRAKAAIILSLQGDQPRAAQVFAALLAKHDKHDPQRQTWASPAWIEKLNDFEWPKAFREALIELAKQP